MKENNNSMTNNTNPASLNNLPKPNTRRERSTSDEGSRALTKTSTLTTSNITATLNNISPFRSLNPTKRRSSPAELQQQQQKQQQEQNYGSIEEIDKYGKPGFLEEEYSDDEILDEDTVFTSTARGGSVFNATDISKRPEFELCATLYKRRGGLGRNAENNWVLRFFTLRGSVLCYHNSPSVKNADPSRPRGRIDLSKEEVIAEMHNMQKPGAPSNHLVTVNIYVLGAKRKWEMCCTDQKQQEEWYHALKRFDNIPDDQGVSSTSPVTRSRKEKAADLGPPPPPLKLRRKSSGHGNEKKGIYSHVSFLEYILHSNYTTAFIAWNIASYIIRYGSHHIYMIVLAVTNLALWQYLNKIRIKEQQSLKSSSIATHTTIGSTEDKMDEVQMLNSFVDTIASASSIKRATSTGTTAEIVQAHGMESNAAIQAWSNTNSTYTSIPNSYWNVDYSLFNLRVGPNYKKLKNKEASGPALYNLYAMDIINSSTTLKHVEDCFELPEIPGVTDIDTGHKYMPPMLIIHASIPMEEPSMLSSIYDGPCFVVVFYFVISQDTLKQIQDMNNNEKQDVVNPALRLFGSWCEKAETDDVFRGRFKAMAIIDSIEDLGLPSIIANANGKPVLINKSGNFTRHSSYIEMSINVFNFSYIAKKCLHMLFPKFVTMVLNVGFTIEGRDDEELPEVLLGGAKVFNLDPDSVPAASHL